MAALLAFVSIGAAPGDRTVPHPGGGPSLVIPADSPVKFRGFDKDGAAHFTGHLLLTGSFIYGCEVDCEGPVTEGDLEIQVLPDPELARRLPHWKDRGKGMVIDIEPQGRLGQSLATGKQRAELLAGKRPDVRGRISIIVDDYVTDFGCDYSPAYSARFVKLAKPPMLAQIPVDGDFGCA